MSFGNESQNRNGQSAPPSKYSASERRKRLGRAGIQRGRASLHGTLKQVQAMSLKELRIIQALRALGHDVDLVEAAEIAKSIGGWRWIVEATHNKLKRERSDRIDHQIRVRGIEAVLAQQRRDEEEVPF